MPKIVVVEDETTIWKLLEFKLKKAGYRMFHAANGEEALDLTRKFHPDLILLDLMIPQPDGLQVLKILKDDKDLSGVPVIILSSLSQDDNILEGLKLGAEDYLTKPFSPEELLIRVQKILKRSPKEA